MAMLKHRIYLPAARHVRTIHNRSRIGTRDVVGYGHNGGYNYKDDPHFPFPAIRFKENTKDILAMRQKECGDWKMLCCEEKKALYRASFCQTYAEFKHPTHQWKIVLGTGLFLCSWMFWQQIIYHHYIAEPDWPDSFSLESQMAQLRRMLELRVQPIDGLSSQWDYDNDCWKYLLLLKREQKYIICENFNSLTITVHEIQPGDRRTDLLKMSDSSDEDVFEHLWSYGIPCKMRN